MMIMKISNIVIPEKYLNTPPKEKLINKKRQYFNEHGAFNSKIIVLDRQANNKRLLVDGYTTYILATELGLESIEVEINTRKLNHRWHSKYRNLHKASKKREILYANQGGKCAICGRPLQITDYTKDDYMTFDHILSVCRGGGNTINNLQGVCHSCNLEKGCDLVM